jgi:hypothetical protein
MARGCYSVACLIPDMGVRCQQKISPRWGWIQFQFWGYKDVAPTALGGARRAGFIWCISWPVAWRNFTR